jgi:tetratricopeptide (TPR) repeat protein
VKPANVLVGRDGRVRIGDFGIAHRGSQTPSTIASSGDEPETPPLVTNTAAGTPAYMSPEQKSGIVDARSDQFSAAISIVEALCAKRPDANDIVEIAAADGVDAARLGAALTRALRREAGERFPTMREFSDELARAIAPPQRIGKRVVIGGAALAAVAIGSIAFGVTRETAAPACAVDEVPETVWSQARRTRIAAITPPNVAPRLDGWFETWSTAAADVCATRATPALRERRRACLAETAADVGRVLDAMEAKTLADPWKLQQALDALPRPSRCSHAAIEKLRAVATPEQTARIAPLLPRLTAFRLDLECKEKPSELVVAAEAIGHAPFTTQALIERAACENIDDVSVSEATLRRAIALAVEASDAPGEIRATMRLVDSLGARHADEAIALADRAHALIAEIGGDPISDAEIEHVLCQLYAARDQDDLALKSCERARRGFRIGFREDSVSETLAHLAAEVRGDSSKLGEVFANASRLGLPAPGAMKPGDPDALIAGMEWVIQMARASGEDTPALRLTYNTNLGRSYQHKDERARALEYFRRAINAGAGLALDATKVEAHHRSAWIMIELAHPAEALEVAAAAVHLARDLGDDTHLAASLDALGLAQVETNDPAAAKTLTEALALRERARADGEARGLTRFLLARALLATDRARARRLATSAADDLQLYLEGRPVNPSPTGEWFTRKAEAELAQINAWLAKNR